jgi:hypothetical protein
MVFIRCSCTAAAVVTRPLLWPVSLLNGALPVLSSVWLLDLPVEKKTKWGTTPFPNRASASRTLILRFLLGIFLCFGDAANRIWNCFKYCCDRPDMPDLLLFRHLWGCLLGVVPDLPFLCLNCCVCRMPLTQLCLTTRSNLSREMIDVTPCLAKCLIPNLNGVTNNTPKIASTRPV